MLLLNSHGINTIEGANQFRDKFHEIGYEMRNRTVFVFSNPEDEIERSIASNLNKYLGIGHENIYICRDMKSMPKELIPNIIYVSEGNTFDLLHYLRVHGFDTYIKKVLKNYSDTIYIGSSAGAMIAGTDVMLALDFDSNYIGMIDFTSLGLINGTIIPHCDAEALEKYKSFKEEHILYRYEDIYCVSDYDVLVL